MIGATWPSVGPGSGVSLDLQLATGAPFLAAGIVACLLLVVRPRVTRPMVVAWVPWAVAAAALAAYATIADYAPIVEVAVAGTGAYLVVFAIAGATWLAMLEFGPSRTRAPDLSVPLFATGSGAAITLVAGAIALGGTLDLARLSLLVLLPIVAAAVAGVVYVSFWFCYPDAAAYTGLAGSLIVFGHALDAMATALGVSAFGGAISGWLAAGTVALATGLDLAGRLGVDGALAWSWLLVWVKLAAAVVVVAALARYARERQEQSNVVLGSLGIAGVVPGMTTLLLILVGG